METATVYGKQPYTSVFYDIIINIIIKLIMQCRLRALCRGLRRTAIDRRRIIFRPVRPIESDFPVDLRF